MEYRLSDKISKFEAEYYFQTIEMAKSDEEYEVELCNTPPALSSDILDLHKVQDEPTLCPWRFVTRRRRSQRRYTFNGIQGAPPAPPSTPTSLTAAGTTTPSPTATNEDRLNNMLYILDYAPKYKKKLKEQQRTDAELADLLSVVTITGSSGGGANGGGGGQSIDRISANSRAIRKPKCAFRSFKVHRSLEKPEFYGVLDEEDSVSAPEYDTEEEDTLYRRRFARKSYAIRRGVRSRRLAKFEHQERMEAISDIFDTAMSFNEA
ncbi:uncharacterized protein LOC119685248 [Teleopsis dalmanni]|uniref:uncharacterized protein LOC119684683 n=1 Tax=Teleopsis dalmanni TaxID=139649 RepID=UPI0018CD4BC5|nr:uncharacterized protein LOC119684683 [Teleopsis dalmanni]XP_037954730.1 uncharacterized protein LOC119684702 [Teleopsis dalmanni]XP_037955415.1 uncharacterized protein LOC119685248 [Teleopsis dalmanni]